MITKKIFLLIFLFQIVILSSQIISDFEGGDLDDWYSEGDGYCELGVGLGNPGDCMKVYDYATGSINYAIAPFKFTGDWSNAAITDSLHFDLKVVTSASQYCSTAWIFEISGPGGKARFTPLDPTPPLNEWTYFSARFDSLHWTMIEGFWADIISNVELLRIRAEYINGDEYILLDNILLSINPIIVPVIPPIVTDFEDGTYDGWHFEDTGSTGIESSGGNPGYCCRVDDQIGVLSQAIAPPKFLGDWTQLDETAVFMLDIKTNQATVNDVGFFIKISGSGGEAIIPIDYALEEAYNHWKTFSYMISDTVWTVNSGTWLDILTNVEEVRIVLEYTDYYDIVRMDNIRISNDKPVADFTSDEVYICPGASVQFEDTSVYAPFEWLWNFGDEQTSSEENPLHIYENSGFYDVQLIVTNFFGTDTLLLENYIEVETLTDSILFCDDFDDEDFHPSWSFNNGTWSEISGVIRQTSNYYGADWINGCFALSGCSAFSDYGISVDFKSSDNDGIGAILYYQDENNFYLFVWRAEINYRGILKYEDGIETELASDAATYSSNTWYDLNIENNTGNIVCSLDDTEIFNVFDTTFTTGKAGLYCWGNQNGYWDNFCIKRNLSLSPPQNVVISIVDNVVILDWDEVPLTNSYKVYSSENPYEPLENWDFEEEVTETNWNEPVLTNEKKFYYVIANN